MHHGALILKTSEHVIAGKLASTMASERCQRARNRRREAAGKPHLFGSASGPPGTLDPGRWLPLALISPNSG
jgi:hypothetical protein